MIARVTIRTPEGHEYPCHLVGFGMTACGNCNALLKILHEGSRCDGCGGKIVKIERRGGTRFEGEGT
jgi:DNA-directed RNA polymerase subunit RPC12/RpoP